MEAKGLIRKISLGDIKEGITYKVGQYMMGGRILIESIVKDVDAQAQHGINKYDIYVSESNADYARLWKSFENLPVAIEYDIAVEVES